MIRAAALLAALLATPSAHAYACLDPADPDQRRWFQDDPCPPGLVDSPLPPPTRVDDPTPSPYRFLPGTPATDGSVVYTGRRWHGPYGGRVGLRPGARGGAGRR